MPPGQARPRPDPGGVDVHPVDDGVRPGKIDILKDTGTLFGLSAVVADAAGAVFIEHHYFTRLQVADKAGLQRVQRAAFGGHDRTAVRRSAVAQRAEAPLVPNGDELGRGHDHQRIRALYPVHGPVDGGFDGGRGDALLGDDVGDDLGVAGGVEDGALHFQLLPQLHGVHKIAVVGQSHAALDVVHHYRLAILSAGAAGGAVAHVSHGHGTLWEEVQHRLCEHLA